MPAVVGTVMEMANAMCPRFPLLPLKPCCHPETPQLRTLYAVVCICLLASRPHLSIVPAHCSCKGIQYLLQINLNLGRAGYRPQGMHGTALTALVLPRAEKADFPPMAGQQPNLSHSFFAEVYHKHPQE